MLLQAAAVASVAMNSKAGDPIEWACSPRKDKAHRTAAMTMPYHVELNAVKMAYQLVLHGRGQLSADVSKHQSIQPADPTCSAEWQM